MGWLLAIISGVMAGFSYPTLFGSARLPDLGFLGLICWVPLFQSLRGLTPRAAFWRSLVAGLFHYGISIYWLYTAMNTFGGLSPAISVTVLLALVFVLSAYFGLIFLLSQWVVRKFGLKPLWIRPLIWIAVEYCRGHLPMHGFPWSQVGYSQGNFLSFIQSADLGGVYLVTFLVVLGNEFLSAAISKILQPRETLGLAFWLAPILLLANVGYGILKLRDSGPLPIRTLKVGVVQGNIPQDEKWQRDAIPKILETFQAGTLELEKQGATLVLWPEASWPMDLIYDADRVPDPLVGYHTDLLFGSITRSKHSFPSSEESPFHNTALLSDPQGHILDYYHKMHLVPLGEYVPWKTLFSFAAKLTQHVGELLPGEEARPMHYRDSLLGVLICYEDIFPEIAQQMAAKGAEVLINLTNDAWYGFSSAAIQHQVFSQFRSIETRRSLLRATNTGISSLIDRYGHILWQGPLFEAKLFLTDLPFYRDRTLYVRLGDWFPLLSMAASAVLLIAAFAKKRKV